MRERFGDRDVKPNIDKITSFRTCIQVQRYIRCNWCGMFVKSVEAKHENTQEVTARRTQQENTKEHGRVDDTVVFTINGGQLKWLTNTNISQNGD